MSDELEPYGRKSYGYGVHGGAIVGQWSGGAVPLRGGAKAGHW